MVSASNSTLRVFIAASAFLSEWVKLPWQHSPRFLSVLLPLRASERHDSAKDLLGLSGVLDGRVAGVSGKLDRCAEGGAEHPLWVMGYGRVFTMQDKQRMTSLPRWAASFESTRVLSNLIDFLPFEIHQRIPHPERPFYLLGRQLLEGVVLRHFFGDLIARYRTVLLRGKARKSVG